MKMKMKMSSKICILLFVLFAVALTGCSIIRREPYRQVANYELLLDARLNSKSKLPIKPGLFRNLTSTSRRMMYLYSDGRLEADDYNQWAQSPETLLEIALSRYFGNSGSMTTGGKYVSLALNIYRFELNMSERKAVIMVRYNIKYMDNDITIGEKFGALESSAGWTGDDAGAKASAMSSAVAKLAADLDKLIDADKKHAKQK